MYTELTEPELRRKLTLDNCFLVSNIVLDHCTYDVYVYISYIYSYIYCRVVLDAAACPDTDDYKYLDCSWVAGNFTSVCQRFSGFDPNRTDFYHSAEVENEKVCSKSEDVHFSIFKM